MESGKLQPQALDLEDAVLGACMLEKAAFELVSEILKPESFYKGNNRLIYMALCSIALRNDPIDIMTVVMELKKMQQLENIGGAYAVTVLTNRVASSANIEAHARIVHQKYLQREMINLASKVIEKSYDEGSDILETMDDFEFQVNTLKSGLHINKTKTTKEIVVNTVQAIKDAKTNGGVLGPATGLRDLDELLRGLRRTNIYVIAGRPAMGKSAIVLCIAKSLCIDQNIPIAIFSLEMSSEQLMHRLLSDIAEIDNNHLASGKLTEFEEHKLLNATSRINENFHLDDTPSITIQYLESRIRKLIQKGVEYIIIDYLQLMELLPKDKKGLTIEQQVSFLTKGLKRLAKKYNVGIIELSQLSRECEKRVEMSGDKKVAQGRPILSDLRDSGAIEQDADVVMFLYRPEYYNIEFTPTGRPSKGLGEIIIAKHRGGPTDTAVVRFRGEFTRFENLEKKEEYTIESLEETPKPIF